MKCSKIAGLEKLKSGQVLKSSGAIIYSRRGRQSPRKPPVVRSKYPSIIKDTSTPLLSTARICLRFPCSPDEVHQSVKAYFAPMELVFTLM